MVDPQENVSGLQAFTVSSLQNMPIPEREWMVEDWITMRSTTILYGDGGTGKSLLAQQAMTCTAAGIKFLELPTKSVPSLALFCEDSQDELHRRQQLINEHYGIEYTDLQDMHWLSRVGCENTLVQYPTNGRPEVTPFFKEFRQMALDLHAKLVVVDTAADTFGGNEIMRAQVRHYVQLLNGLAYDIGGSTLLCAHPSVQGMANGTGTGGSTAWSNTARSRLYLDRPNDSEDKNLRILTRRKTNYAGVDDIGIKLRWEKGVLRVQLEAGQDTVDWIKERNCMKEFLAAMRKLAEEGISLSVSKHSASFAPKQVHKKNRAKYKYAEIENAMHKLLNDGYIKNESYGSPSKNLHRLKIIKDME